MLIDDKINLIIYLDSDKILIKCELNGFQFVDLVNKGARFDHEG